MKPVLKKTLGILLLIIGLAALVTPLTPGSWLIFVGLELLGLGFVLDNLPEYWRKKMPERWRKKKSGQAPSAPTSSNISPPPPSS